MSTQNSKSQKSSAALAFVERSLDVALLIGLLGVPVGCLMLSTSTASTSVAFGIFGTPVLVGLAVIAGALRLLLFVAGAFRNHRSRKHEDVA